MEMMEISLMAPTNVQVSNYIPDDIAFSILSKLPIKSLKRFECGSKSWSLLFDNPYFMTMYRNNFLSKEHSYYHDTSLLLNVTRGKKFVLYSLSGERFKNRINLDWPKMDDDDPLPIQEDDDDSMFQEDDDDLDDPPYDSDEDAYDFDNQMHHNPENDDDSLPYQANEEEPLPFQEDDDNLQFQEEDDNDEDASGFEILGSASINGTLCLYSLRNGNEKLILWNPTTNELKVIPSSTILSESYRSFVYHTHHLVGYDRVKVDYKVIRFTTCTPFDLPNSTVSFWEIYSLSSNSWRKIEIDMPPSYTRTKEVYLDGVSHWLDEGTTNTYLFSFDFGNESFISTTISSDVDECPDSVFVWKDLVILNGSIAFILNYEELSTFHISILGELGVMESWIKLFILGPFPCLDNPIGAGKKGNILFRKKDGKLAWFDLNSGMIDEIGVTAERCDILFHKESILPIG